MSQTCQQISQNQNFRCYSCPPVPPAPSRPAQYIVLPQLGWDAAARSQARIDGDCFTEFTVEVAAGAVVGFANRILTTDPVGVPQGFLFESVNGLVLWSAIENGARLTAPAPAPAGALWRLQRHKNMTSWMINRTPELSRPSIVLGALVVVGCLYSSSDRVG
jgi:hypothetical protein